MPVVPFAPSQPQAAPSGPVISEEFLAMAAADMHAQGRLFKIADTELDDALQIELENTLYKHATGEYNNETLKKNLPSGWSVDLRKGNPNGPYELLSPSGSYHRIQP